MKMIMKKRTRVLSFILAIAMIFSVNILRTFAEDVNGNWSSYQGNSNKNGQINSAVPTTSNRTVDIYSFGAGGWSGVDTEPIMCTYNNEVYSFVIYNGGTYAGAPTENANGYYSGTGGARLGIVNCTTKTSSSIALSKTSGFQLSTPFLEGSGGTAALYVAVSDYFDLLANNEFETNSNWSLNNATIDTVDEAAYVTNATGTISQHISTASSTNIQLTGSLVLTSGNSASYAITAKNGSTTYTLSSGTIGNTITYIEELCSDKFPNPGDYDIKLTVTAPNATVKVDYVKLNRQSAPCIKKVSNLFSTALTSESVGGASYGGQINTPIMKYGDYLYYGTYNGGNKYYQLNLTTGSVNILTGLDAFYWSGVNVVTISGSDYVVFGGDGGYLYCTPVNDFGGAATKTHNLSILENCEAGNVRSSISKDGNYFYFTSQGGYMWKVKIDTVNNPNPTLNKVTLGGTSTSTPAISSSGKIYVGYYNGFTSGGINIINKDSFFVEDTHDTKKPVQSSIIVKKTEENSADVDYIYFTTNDANGQGRCCSYTPSTKAKVDIWNTNELGICTYTLQGMASCDGYMSFGNDKNYFYVIH